MSTKIYTAFRYPKADVFELAQVISQKAWAFAAKELHERSKHILANCVNTVMAARKVRETLNRGPGADHAALTRMNCEDYIHKMYVQQLGLSQRNDYDFDAWVSVYTKPHHLYAYLIPGRGDALAGIFDFLPRLGGIEEYGYWNNSDEPENISHADWKKRGKIWESVTENRVPLIIDVVSPSNWFYVGAFGPYAPKEKR